MKTIFYRISRNRSSDSEAIEKAGDIIRTGGLVALPTETVYGLGASAYSPQAAEKIYAAKGRPSDNPLIVHVSEPESAERVAHTSDLFYNLARSFMPGPLTVILPKKSCIPNEVTGGLDTVAVRCPSNEIARRIIEASGVPVAAPSANSSGKPSPTTASHVLHDLDGKIDMIVDGGDCEIGVESTVISISGDKCRILRPGAVSADQLGMVCGEVEVDEAVIDPSLAGDHPKSPGMKYRHYSPEANIILVDGGREKFIDYVNGNAGENDGVFTDRNTAEQFSCKTLVTGERGTADEFTHNLYALLRCADELSLKNVYVQLPPSSDKYLALYNRIIRAAGGNIVRL